MSNVILWIVQIVDDDHGDVDADNGDVGYDNGDVDDDDDHDCEQIVALVR